MKKIFNSLAITVVFLCSPLWNGSFGAEKGAMEFYEGKNISIIVPYAPGGGYDVNARVFGTFLAKYTKAASVIVKNMPGAGGIRGTNFLYNTAKPDGLTLATFAGDTALLSQLFGLPEVSYELDQFSWIGNFFRDDPAIIIGSKLPYTTPNELAKLEEFKMGTARDISGMSMNMVVFANAFDLNNMKLITGYEGMNEIVLAIARGELHASGTGLATLQRFAEKGGLVKVFSILAKERARMAPEVPTIYELAEKSGQPLPAEKAKWVDIRRQWLDLTRPILAPPNLPEDRLQFLRDVFWKIINDKEFQKEWEKSEFTLDNPTQGKQLQEAAKLVKMPEKDKEEFKFLLTKKYIK